MSNDNISSTGNTKLSSHARIITLNFLKALSCVLFVIIVINPLLPKSKLKYGCDIQQFREFVFKMSTLILNSMQNS
jgi:hypothetical protein